MRDESYCPKPPWLDFVRCLDPSSTSLPLGPHRGEQIVPQSCLELNANVTIQTC